MERSRVEGKWSPHFLPELLREKPDLGVRRGWVGSGVGNGAAWGMASHSHYRRVSPPTSHPGMGRGDIQSSPGKASWQGPDSSPFEPLISQGTSVSSRGSPQGDGAVLAPAPAPALAARLLQLSL